ncbi:hypothetical protein GCM10007422_45010 [Pedobacter zeae]|nr:hypothetical protein GCM10007422_45010 [Pedobacter zeae]
MLTLACKKEVIDIAQLALDKPLDIDLNGYASRVKNQNGHIEAATDGFKTVDKGEKVVCYYFAGNKDITFEKAKIDDVLETKVITYNGIVSFIGVHPDNRDAVSLLKYLLKTHSTPDSVSYDTTKFIDSEKETANVLKDAMPGLVKEVADEFDNKSTQYPQQLFWSKNNILTHITLDPTNAHLNMSVKIITKQAYMGHIVQEYAKPLFKEYDSPFAHLFKNNKLQDKNTEKQ